MRRGARVEAELVGGLLGCPLCRGALGPWGHARERMVRGGEGRGLRVRPRRAKCRACAKTHVLLSDFCLLRRRDVVAVIGEALVARAAGAGHRGIAERSGVPKDTVRGWLRRFAAGAEQVRAHFARWAVALDPELGPIVPAGSGFADGDRRRGQGVGVAVWTEVVVGVGAMLSGGVLLCNTSCPFPPVR